MSQRVWRVLPFDAAQAFSLTLWNLFGYRTKVARCDHVTRAFHTAYVSLAR